MYQRKRSLNNRSKLQIPVIVKRNDDHFKTTEIGHRDLYVPGNEFKNSTSNSSLARASARSNQNGKTRSNFLKTILPSLHDPQNKNANKNEAKTQYDIIKSQNLVEFDNRIDEFYNLANSVPLTQAIETFFNKIFTGISCFWEDINSLQTMFSQTFLKTCKRNKGFPGEAFISRQIVNVKGAKSNPSFDQATDGLIAGDDSSVLCIPLWSHNNSIIGVVEVSRNEEFTEVDEVFATFFVNKFKAISKWVLEKQPNNQTLFDLLQLLSLEQYAAIFKTRMSQYFNCRTCEIWSHSKESGEILMVSDSVSKIDPSKGGIALDSLFNHKMVNCQHNKLHSCYNPQIDGSVDEAILVVPIIQSKVSVDYAIILRGPKSAPLFTKEDEDNLKKIAPYVALAMANASAHSEFFNDFQRSRFEQEGLTALLEVAEVLSSQLNLEQLTKTIMEKGRSLTNADRCSLFLVNDSGDRLISFFQKGLNSAIDIPITAGCVGYSVKENKIINISNAYDDPHFDPSTDVQTGYHTTSLLCVPIYNNKGEVMGVTEMVNKLDGKPFSQWDAKVIQIFNVFCGISIENARLYNESLGMSQQLQSFFDVTVSLSKKEDVEKVLNDIISNARKVVEAERASVFVVDPVINCLKKFISDGGSVPETLPMNKGIAAYCASSKKPLIVNDPYHDPRFNRTVDNETGFKTNNIIVVPIINTSGEIIGVAELINKKKGSLFTDSDVKILVSFATFAAMTFEKSKLQDIAQLGETEVEMMKYIGESERSRCDEIPALLRLPQDLIEKAKQLNFMTRDLEPMDRIKLLFFEFYDFGIPQEFKISNEMLFRFIYEVMKTYHKVPYHNWIHAVDVTQYVAYEARTAKLPEIYSKFDLFGLLVAAVCHDAGHDGFNNIYNVKAETPLGILFKDQSVMETHHCTVAISILTRDECNLFHSLSESEVKSMWNLVIKLILATDMAFHFKLVKSASEMCDAGPFNINNLDMRLLGLQLILKVADISIVSRPFMIADKWCDVLNEEFFRQGDHEKAQGFGLTSPLNDREHPDKPKSQIGFYNFICIPLYSVITRFFPQLDVNLNSVKSNLEVWKSLMPPAPPANQ